MGPASVQRSKRKRNRSLGYVESAVAPKRTPVKVVALGLTRKRPCALPVLMRGSGVY